MCGFVVAIGRRTETSQLKKALTSIRHRGPDDIGIWQNRGQTISFGHVRLSIIDLAGGIQPLTNHDESLVAVVNGEFYGYEEIRKNLEKDGYQFKTQSDSEILLGLYERYGSTVFTHLRGEFAFVLFDKKNQLVFAARDYFGIKPLFYRNGDDGIYFASEAKAFLGLGLPLAFSEENFFQTMCLFPNPEETLFSQVLQIPPAHYLVKSFFSRTPKLQSYWDFNYPKENEQRLQISDEEAIEGLDQVLREAIRLRLRADVPVACYLSGGLDSCSILGIAQKESTTPIKAFTLTFDHEDYDESSQAREMAEMVGAPFHPIAISQQDIAASFEDAIWHAERFLKNGHAVAKFLLSRAVRDAKTKVVLTGEGSDEIFAGYAHFRQDKILQDQKLTLAEKMTQLDVLRDANKVSTGFLLSSDVAMQEQQIVDRIGFFPSFMQSFIPYRSHIMDILNSDLLQRLGERHSVTHVLNFLDVNGQVLGRDYLSRSLYLWSKLILPYYLLTVLGDRMEMAHSVEGRLPFLDHRVVEYVVSLPSTLKIRGLTEKYILRQVAKPYITDTIYRRQKHPFLAPPAFLAKENAMTELVEDTLRSEELKKISLIDHKKVTALLDRLTTTEFASQRTSSEPLLLSLLSACLLHKRIIRAANA